MSGNLFVGGFPYETTQAELAALFGGCGTVKSVKILTERETGRSRGIGFVEMSSAEEARAAITKLNGSMVGARKLFVTEARPPEKRPGAPGGYSGKPGFVERRSGKDRRQAPGGPGGDSGRRENPFAPKRKWDGKPGFPGKKKWSKGPSSEGEPKKSWGDKPWSGGEKRSGPPKKKWSPPGGGKKWDRKPRRFDRGPEGRGGR